jgi:hypothetical protein
MFGRIMKLVRHAQAPNVKYLALHPIKGARMWRAARKPKNVRALTGAGAAVLAVPIGFWLARRRR